MGPGNVICEQEFNQEKIMNKIINKKNEVVLFGGGGHCRSCIDVMESEGKIKIAGIVDEKRDLGDNVSGYPILGRREDLPRLCSEYRYFFLTIGFIKDCRPRLELFDHLLKLGAEFPVFVSSQAYVSRLGAIDAGTILLHRVLVNSHARVGKNCIINTGAIIEHDAVIGDHCHISTNCTVNGTATIGARCFIGSNSVIGESISLTDDVIVGAGSVVIKNITEPGTYVGNPAKKIK